MAAMFSLRSRQRPKKGSSLKSSVSVIEVVSTSSSSSSTSSSPSPSPRKKSIRKTKTLAAMPPSVVEVRSLDDRARKAAVLVLERELGRGSSATVFLSSTWKKHRGLRRLLEPSNKADVAGELCLCQSCSCLACSTNLPRVYQEPSVSKFRQLFTSRSSTSSSSPSASAPVLPQPAHASMSSPAASSSSPPSSPRASSSSSSSSSTTTTTTTQCKCVKAVKERTRQMVRGSFALKIVPRSKEREFFAERAALTTLQAHPHIPRCLFAGQTKSGDYLMAQQLGTGGDVLSLVERDEYIPEHQAAPLFLQVLAAVRFAHSNFIVHRDIKLENLVFTDYSQTKVLLIDWGISARYSPDAYLHEDCGSLHYASPELLTGIPYVGPEVDCWALGVLLYTMIAGYFPYGGETVNKKRIAMLAPVSFPSRFSPSLRSLISGLLQLKPSARSTVAQAMKHPWFMEQCPHLVDCKIASPLARARSFPIHLDVISDADVPESAREINGSRISANQDAKNDDKPHIDNDNDGEKHKKGHKNNDEDVKDKSDKHSRPKTRHQQQHRGRLHRSADGTDRRRHSTYVEAIGGLGISPAAVSVVGVLDHHAHSDPPTIAPSARTKSERKSKSRRSHRHVVTTPTPSPIIPTVVHGTTLLV